MVSSSQTGTSCCIMKLRHKLSSHTIGTLIQIYMNYGLEFIFAFHRPLSEEGLPIDQSELDGYRSSHVFAYPGCLCPAISNSEVQTETVLFTVSNGGDTPGEEYQATCAKRVCGYTGKNSF